MNVDPRVRVYDELAAGNEVEAWYGGRLRHRGPIIELAPSAGMFWITDHIGGGRKILDLEDFVVLRVQPQLHTRSDPERTAA